MTIHGILQVRGDLEPAVVLELEQWLNGEVAVIAFQKFSVGLRVHLTEEERSVLG